LHIAFPAQKPQAFSKGIFFDAKWVVAACGSGLLTGSACLGIDIARVSKDTRIQDGGFTALCMLISG
jgi:hypothetical protein